MKRMLIMLLVLSLQLVLLVSGASAATYTVSNSNDTGAGSLRAAITAANGNAGVDYIDATGAGGTIVMGSNLPTITEGVIINGSGPDNFDISGSSTYLCIVIDSASNDQTVIINDLRVSNCNNTASNGGGIIIGTGDTLNANNLHLFSNGSDYFGGGLYIDGSLSLTNSTVYNNSANFGGGIAVGLNCNSLNIYNSTITGNTSNLDGGGIATQCTNSVIRNCTISGNTATFGDGGGIQLDGGSLVLTNNIIYGNTASGDSDCNIFDGSITTNTKNLIGGGQCSAALSADPGLGTLQDNGGLTQTMAIASSSPAFNAGDNASCTATDQRGTTRPQVGTCDIGAFEYAPFTVTNLNDSGAGSLRQAIINANANAGADIIDATGVTGTITLASNLPAVTNSVTINGSGAANLTVSGADTYRGLQFDGTANDQTFYLNDVAISNCTIADQAGAGIFLNYTDTLYINDSHIKDGTSNYFGAGIGAYSTLYINGSTISDNTTTTTAGGILIDGSTSNATITNSTIANNTANYAGGIYCFECDFVLKGVTISGNVGTSGNGGGILIETFLGPASLVMRNTIISDSTGTDCYPLEDWGVITIDLTDSLIEDNTCSPTFSGDPGLGALQDNGGPTLTMAITEASSAYNTGDNATCGATDQRGITRPQGATCDIGAFELEVYTLHAGWNMVGAPYETAGADAATVFGSWAADSYTWASSSQTDPDNSGTWIASPGMYNGSAVWVWGSSGQVLSVTAGITTSGSHPTTVVLVPGWNLITNPSTTVLTGIGSAWLIDAATLTDAITGSTIGGDLYWWDGSAYVSYNVALDNPDIPAWKGFWILNLDSANHTLTLKN